MCKHNFIFVATKKRTRSSKAAREGAAEKRTGGKEAIRGNGKKT